MATSNSLRKRKLILQFIALASFITLVWLAGIFIYLAARDMLTSARTSLSLVDRATILFGGASIALFILSILLALLAIFGWNSIQRMIVESVDEAVNPEVERLENELRGRVISGLGYMIGELSFKFGSLEPEDKDRLSHSVELCSVGYQALRKVGGPVEMNGLNNLVFYGSLQGDPADRRFLLNGARELREYAHKRHVPRFMLTYCRAILRYSSDPAELREAAQIAEELASSPSIRPAERNEAKVYVEAFRSRTDHPPAVAN
jgi:hypothetical protein